MSDRGQSDRWLVGAIVLAQFGPAFMFSGVAVAAPTMGRELDMSATVLGLVETTFLASAAAFLLPAGRIADAASRSALFRWSLLAFGGLSLAIGCVSQGWLVLLIRFFQGISAALASAAGPALLMDLVPAQRRGSVFGAMMGMAYAGLALGPLVAGFVVEQWGWRAVFFVGAAQILIGGLPALLRIKRHAAIKQDHFRPQLHWPSVVLLALGMSVIVAALSIAEHRGAVWPWAIAAVAAFAAFAVWQLRLSQPLLDLRELGRNATLSSALLTQLLLYLNAYCSIFLLSLFLQVQRGMPARSAGFVLATGSVVMASIAPFAGRVADRLRPQLLAGLGIGAVCFSSLLGFWLDANAPAWRVALVLAAQGVGFGLFSSPNLSLILGSLPRDRSGFASAVAAQSRSLGMFSGMAVTSALIATNFGSRPVRDHPAGVVTTLHSAYAVLLATGVIALLIACARRAKPTDA